MSLLLASEFETLVNHPDFLGILAITLGCLTGMVAIIFSTLTGVAKAKSREATKREIAAYVAEGSIDPDKAVALLNAGATKCDLEDLGDIT